MPPTFTTIGSYRIHRDEQSISGPSGRVQLTPKAFAVLQQLLANAGRLVTHEQLLNAVWPETFVQQEVLKVYVRELRRAFQDDAKHPKYIETASRRGYRLIAPVEEDSAAHARLTPRQQLVGRDVVLDELRNAFQTAEQGTRQMVFVTGESGI